MFAPRSPARAAGIMAGYLADTIFGDPHRGHPVALFGNAATAVERVTYRDGKWAGVLHTAALVGALVLSGAALQRAAARFGLAFATWVALGGRSLTRAGSAMADALARGDVGTARQLLPSLCGRDPHVLDADGLTRAAVESIAENTSDAHVAPLLWAVAGGVPAVLAYRGVNTLDAMIGYRSPRYRQFGWAAARLDDIVNIVPARVTAALVAACAPVIGGSPIAAVRAWRSDAGRHSSPNAGVVEAAFAGALGVRLGGPTEYAHVTEIRPLLGDGRAPRVEDLRRALRLSSVVQVLAVAVAVLIAVGRSGRPASPRS